MAGGREAERHSVMCQDLFLRRDEDNGASLLHRAACCAATPMHVHRRDLRMVAQEDAQTKTTCRVLSLTQQTSNVARFGCQIRARTRSRALTNAVCMQMER